MGVIQDFIIPIIIGIIYALVIYNETYPFITNLGTFLSVMIVYFVVSFIIWLTAGPGTSGTPIDQEKMDRHTGRDKE